MIPVPARLLVGGLLITAALGAGGGPDVDPEPAPERSAGAPDALRYGRDIRPILSDRCILIHRTERETQRAGLRLDTRAEAVADRDGFAAIVPGDPEASLLYQRITSTDPDDQMPPPESGKHSLTPDQVRLVRTWIEQGAVYESHWAFEAPVRPRTPEVSDPEWCTN
ncbi:MAG: c-type cytochrome domain-containing protein, partial [Planctomycetota bacterium]|nr:c-type cytochrome domain-containing protein [Planctomycetota bacterium]